MRGQKLQSSLFEEPPDDIELEWLNKSFLMNKTRRGFPFPQSSNELPEIEISAPFKHKKKAKATSNLEEEISRLLQSKKVDEFASARAHAIRLVNEEDELKAEVIDNSSVENEDDNKKSIITYIEPTEPPANTLASHIFKTLSRHKRSLHLNELISKLEKKKLLRSKHHKYSQVYAAIKNNYYLFRKTGKAEFTVRVGFKKQEPAVAQARVPSLAAQPLPNLADIILTVSKEYKDPSGVYPSLIHTLVSKMGYKCNYSTVRRAMQDTKRFTRNGYWYNPK